VTERFPRVASLKTPERFRAHLASLGSTLPCDDRVETGPRSALGRRLELGGGMAVPNRFVVQPMEGWDGHPDGRPSALTRRRWRRFGESGCGWIWGGEAVAVREDGRANPNQLIASPATARGLGALRRVLLAAAHEAGHPAPLVGLQLTHSGRWSMPRAGERRPRTAYRHPLLDRRVGADDGALLGDSEVEALIPAFAEAARIAEAEGFAFVDLKHCHGYLLHEFLSARERPGPWGGPSLAARSRLALALLSAIRTAAPSLRVGVRLSVFDAPPYDPSGAPEHHPAPYAFAFGADPDAPGRRDLREPIALVRRLLEEGVSWINVTAASPYYAPHLQRPAAFPPSDGYAPPEDPLLGVARLLEAARDIKTAAPEAIVVASGTSYLQDSLPHVAQACLRAGWFDAVGYGRMALSYPTLAADALAGRPLQRTLLCRTFSDCTTAPRRGLVSGCYPLDPFYRARPEREALERAKRAGSA